MYTYYIFISCIYIPLKTRPIDHICMYTVYSYIVSIRTKSNILSFDSPNAARMPRPPE